MMNIESKHESPNPRQIDWVEIEKEYRAGQLSNVEIGKQFGVSEGAIRKKAKKNGWEKDLSNAVRSRVREKLVRATVRTTSAELQTDQEIINSASERGVAVITLHRTDINRVREMEQTLLAELSDADNQPTKIHVCQFQGKVIKTVIPISVTERAAALNSLANVQNKRISLERIAWNLDEEDRNTDKLMIVLN